MRNFFSYLRLPVSTETAQLRDALSNVPDDEYDIHHVLANDVSLTHYKRVYLQCTAMAVLLASDENEEILNKPQWQQRLSEFDALEDLPSLD